MERLNLQPEIIVGDSCKWQPKKPLDGVLIDAPCSATGTLRRYPDIYYTKTTKDMDVSANIQKLLIKSAHNMVRKGGLIVFSTCSLQPKEGTELVDSVLAEEKSLSRLPISAKELELTPDMVNGVGDLRTLPFHEGHIGGMDGFFAARLVRN